MFPTRIELATFRVLGGRDSTTLRKLLGVAVGFLSKD